MHPDEYKKLKLEKIKSLIPNLRAGDLIEVEFNGATGIVRFVGPLDEKSFMAFRWLDGPKKIRPGARVYYHRVIGLADPDQPRVKRAIAAFKNPA